MLWTFAPIEIDCDTYRTVTARHRYDENRLRGAGYLAPRQDGIRSSVALPRRPRHPDVMHRALDVIVVAFIAAAWFAAAWLGFPLGRR